MSEPAWVALGAAAVDYEGEWAAGTSYAPGDVVTRNGITYLAVNPSLAQTPPDITASGAIGTSLPASPTDGQEFVLVDSLTAPTYSWRFRYVAGITDAYKWVFIGGAPAIAEVAAQIVVSGGYTAYAGGPSIVIPRAGEYLIGLGFTGSVTNAGAVVMSYDVGATTAVDADGVWCSLPQTGMPGQTNSRFHRKAGIAASTALACKYRMTAGGSNNAYDRWISIQPVRVA